jgi:hypothetical protein
VIVRFERNVHRRAAHVFIRIACRAQCLGFGVRLAFTVMPAFTERATVANDDRTDRWIGNRIGNRARR